jgi:hypothetical protein
MPKQMDHAAYQKRMKKASEASLRYILKDAREAIEAQPFGENAGYYADEIHYAAMELRRRGDNASPLPPLVKDIGIPS